MQPFPKKDEVPNFSDPAVQKAFVQNTADGKSLMQKELDVNHAEQVLLKQRILLSQSFINDLPASDPQYFSLLVQVQMDQIELDELRTRELLLNDKLSR